MIKVGEIYRPTRFRGRYWIRRYVFERKLGWRFKSLGPGKGLYSERAYFVKVRRCDLEKAEGSKKGYPTVGLIEEFEEVEFNKFHIIEPPGVVNA